MTTTTRNVVLALAFGLVCAGAARAATPAPASTSCPPPVPASARCYTGQDGAGAFYWIAVPRDWNQVLVMHAHGGPETGPPLAERSRNDLERWAVTVKAGYAWAGSTYRRGGYGVTMAAEDTERLRQLFVRHFGSPRRTLLHGQSYGGAVASKAAELYASVDGKPGPFDGVLLTNGVLGGGNSAYEFRLDLRVVYQYVCRNHPRPEEPQYPLWMGLPKDSTLTRAELAERVKTCTGVGLPAARRTPEQAARLRTITSVVKIPERTLLAHLGWATWLFRDLVQERLGGRNPFGNVGVVYQGSGDDAALNAGVLRYAADPQAQGALALDSRPTGRTSLPTLTLHAIDDPTAFVELESVYRAIRESAGTSDRLVQSFSDEAEHSYLSDPEYAALFAALLDWIDKGEKPAPASLAARCAAFEPSFGNGGKDRCRFRPDYRPAPLESRVPPR